MKICSKCGRELPRRAFYRHPHMADGRFRKCKDCTKADVRANRAAKIEQYRVYDRQRARTPQRRQQILEYNEQHRRTIRQIKKEWALRNPEKRIAHNAVWTAIRNGKLKRSGCEICGKPAQAHHDDYSRPFDIRWLCPWHHSQHHIAVRDLQRSFTRVAA